MGGSRVIVLDTHVWVWWLSDPDRLSRRVVAAIEQEVAAGDPVRVSAISVWEVAMLVQRERLRLAVSLERWLSLARAMPELDLVPVTPEIAHAAVALPGDLHKDPADRMIVATARELGATLLTKDVRLLDYPHVRSLW